MATHVSFVLYMDMRGWMNMLCSSGYKFKPKFLIVWKID